MHKLLYFVGAMTVGAFMFLTTSCGNSAAERKKEVADSIQRADSIAKVQADSIAKAKADSIAKAKADSITKAKTDSIAKVQAKAKLIEKDLTEFCSLARDIRTGFYVSGQYCPGTHMAYETFIWPARSLNAKLRGKVNQMTPNQKARYYKARNSIREALI